jgi:hypothetical protein
MEATSTETKKRSKPEKKYDVEDVDFVYRHYTQMSATQIAEERGLAKFQVQQIVTNLRKAGADLPKKTSTNIIQDYVDGLKKRSKRK